MPDDTQATQIDKKRKAIQVSQKHNKRTEQRVESSRLRLMIGFGIPWCTPVVTYRKILDDAIGPPYFYYENVALTPKGVWE